MSEKLSEVWECYDMEVLSTCRGRGMVVLRTNQGIRVLQPLETSESRLEQEAQIKEALYEAGYQNVDRFVRNLEGELITCDRYHTPYVLKEFFEGRECNIYQENDMVAAVMNLAQLHLALKTIEIQTPQTELKTLHTFRRHNREMKRVRQFMQKIPTKSEFDYLYLTCFEDFYRQGLEIVRRLEQAQDTLAIRRCNYCHGAYHQHNIILMKDGMATINFEHFSVDNQLIDLYTFLRKVMEKNEYQPELLFRLIAAYDSRIPLEEADYIFLYYMLWYPEKFWKISNQYNNMNKAWIPPKTFEKLQTVIRQEEAKQRLLEEFAGRYHLGRIMGA